MKKIFAASALAIAALSVSPILSAPAFAQAKGVGVADVRMTRADKRNALDGKMFQALADAGEQLKSERGVRAVVLSGEGSSFCAGLDFSSFQSMAGGDGAGGGNGDGGGNGGGNPGSMQDGRITHLGQQVAWVWQEVPAPVIAAVHGHALGGGIQIATTRESRRTWR